MKKIYFIAVLFSLVLFTNCSSDSKTSLSPTEQKLVGKWYFSDPSVQGYSENNSFTFTSDKKITYTYWSGDSTNTFDSETGTFSCNGNKLTMLFPKGTTYTYVQNIVFLTDKKVQFVATGNPSEEPYDGTYYKN